MSTNNKISNLVYSQVPFFVRNDHPNFVTFLEKYYQYLEQEDKAVNRIKNVKTYQDVDLTIDQYSDLLYNTFMKYLPKNVLADRDLMIKHIKDFYRAKGTEDSLRWFFRIFFNADAEIYYPRVDIFRASDAS